MEFTETRDAGFTATAKNVHKTDRAICHNESMFQNMRWDESEAEGGVMVSDFVNGFPLPQSGERVWHSLCVHAHFSFRK